MVEIILNLKNLAAKINSDDDTKILRIEAGEQGPITAGDIIADADVEILDTDLHICTLESDAALNMEIALAKGRGYIPADQNKDAGLPIGIILLTQSSRRLRKLILPSTRLVSDKSRTTIN